MATVNWDTVTIDGNDYWVIPTPFLRVPKDWDPSSNMFIALSVPTGGIAALPVLATGDTGPAPDIDTSVDLTALEYGDSTADSAQWTETSPGVYRFALAIHKGQPGTPGTMAILSASDLAGSPIARQTLVVNATATGFDFATVKVGDRYIPTTINSTPSGNQAYTLCSVTVPPLGFDWRPSVTGQCVVTGTGPNVAVDLLARLNDATTGNIVGRGVGVAGQNPPTHHLEAGPPAGSADGYDKVAGNATAVIYMRAEITSGSDTFTTNAATTTFRVKADPVP